MAGNVTTNEQPSFWSHDRKKEGNMEDLFTTPRECYILVAYLDLFTTLW